MRLFVLFIFWFYQSLAEYRLKVLNETSISLFGILTLVEPQKYKDAYGADLKKLTLEVFYQSNEIVRVKITDASSTRWEIPNSIIERVHPVNTQLPETKGKLQYSFKYIENLFSFEIVRLSDNFSVFKSDGFPLIFQDQYIELSTSIDEESATYGLGESTRTNHALVSNKTFTMWAADIGSYIFNSNLYGSYPFYLQMLKEKKNAHGVLMMNSNGMDIDLNDKSITFKMIGGIIDLYVSVGPTPIEVVSQYTSIVGKPAMMPYWSLGFHNCKWGYKNIDEVKEVVKNYSIANIPLDTQWVDIDYMQNYKDFTLDSVNFPMDKMDEFVDNLHNNGQHFIPIVDPGIMVTSNYDALEEGLKQDIFIKDVKGGYYLGEVWPGATYFPDFIHPNAKDYWTNQLNNFHKLVSFDGIWIDMNEVSNFCNSDGMGQVCELSQACNYCVECSTVEPTNKYDFPPYKINNQKGILSVKTVAMSATQYGNIPVYNTHNLYGLAEQIVTNSALKSILQKRPFVLSRSSFLSTGVHSAKWTGDNAATWDDLKASIVSIMDFNIFGVPMIGADICGFNGDTTEELCARWIEVGSFYPFARNHNTFGALPQELYRWESVAEASRQALSIRYQLLPYLYSLFYAAHTRGEPVIRPLWMNFRSDSNALQIDEQFMWGSGVLFSPVLTSNTNTIKAYFPQGLWYSFNDQALSVDASEGGFYTSLYTPLTATNVHIFGGTIIPLQTKGGMNTKTSRLLPFIILNAFNNDNYAQGSLFIDNGDELELNNYLDISFQSMIIAKESEGDQGASGTGLFKNHIIHNSILTSSDNNNSISYEIGIIIIMGKEFDCPTQAWINNYDNNKQGGQLNVICHYNMGSITLIISNIKLKIYDEFEIIWK
eukprot:gene6616-9083_t